MSTCYIFGYKDTSILNTKSYELLLSTLNSSSSSAAIITNTSQDAENLTKLLKQSAIKKEAKITCYALNEFIDLHFHFNVSRHLSHIDSYFKLYLSSFSNNQLESLLYSSAKLRKDFLTSYLTSPLTGIDQLELELSNKVNIKSKSIKIAKSFDAYLTKKLKFCSENFYTNTIKHPTINQIKNLFFINPIIKYNIEKKHLNKILNIYKSQTWIVNTENKDCINWLKSSNKDHHFILQNRPSQTPNIINRFPSVETEINYCLNSIKTCLNDDILQKISIIIPNNHIYKDTLEMKLTHQNIEFSSYYTNSKITTLIKSFFITNLQFLNTDFNLESLYSLSSNPICKKIYLNSENQNKEILFDIHTLILIQQKYSEEIEKSNKTTSLNTLFEFINTKDQFNTEKIKNLITLCNMQKKTHIHLSALSNTDSWFLEFQKHLSQYKEFSLNINSNKHIKHDIKKLLEIIGSTLMIIKKENNFKSKKKEIIDLLIENIKRYCPKNTAYKTNISVYYVDQARYVKHEKCYILGFNNSLYKQKTHTGIFDSIFSKKPSSTSIKTLAYQSELIDEINTLSSTTTISMAATLQDEVQLPTALENISLKEIVAPSAIEKTKPLPPIEKIKFKLKTNLNITSLSATQIDLYNRCPYKFWLEQVLKLDSIKPETNEISTAQWGIFVHDVLNSFNVWILKNPNQTKEASIKKLKSIAYTNFSAIINPNIFWKTKYKNLITNNDTPGMLETIVAIYFSNDILSSLLKTEQKYTKDINKTTIKGTIDAVFETPYGPIVIDYKTGKTLASSKDIELLRSLQIPIYFLCISNKNTPLAQAGIYFQIHSKDKTAIHLKACTKEIKSDYLKHSKQRPFIYDNNFMKKIEAQIEAINNLIKENYFSPDYTKALHDSYKNRSKTCQFCTYKISCRYKQRMAL
jgi:RecB family exonuclease